MNGLGLLFLTVVFGRLLAFCVIKAWRFGRRIEKKVGKWGESLTKWVIFG